MKALQLTVLVAFTALGLSAIPLLWVGIAPEQDFLAFLGSAGALAPIAGLASAVIACWAFVLGWDPAQAALKKIRDVLVVRLFSSQAVLIAALLVCVAALGLVGTFIATVDAKANPVFDLLLSDNFDSADEELARAKISPERFADLYVVTNALRQQVRLASQAGDKTECRIHVNYLERRRTSFQPLWWRYMFALSKAACFQVLENPIFAVRELDRALAIAAWLSDYEVRRVSRSIARIQFMDKTGTAGIKDRGERLRHVVRLISTDPDKTALRMLGASYFELGEYAKAIETWQRSLDGEKGAIERKKLLNNLALAYGAMAQHNKARELVREALALAYDENVEGERREQVRLLATAAFVSTSMGDCKEADDAWSRREILKRQERSTCTALIEAQVFSCRTKGGVFAASRKEKVVAALLFAAGQKQETFVDRTPEAFRALLEQAELRFRDCYLGLKFSGNPVKAVLLPQ